MTFLRVQDIGCADGFFSIACTKRGDEVIGLDLEQDTADCASWAVDKLGLQSVQSHCLSASDLDQLFGDFDMTLMLALLYHLRDPLSGVWLTQMHSYLCYVFDVN